MELSVRRRGTPQKRFMDIVREDVQRAGVTDDDLWIG